jgi:hypothetical protein
MTMENVGYIENLGPGSAASDDAPGGAHKRYYGKYRGTVLQNVDPERRGRVLVRVPAVLGYFNSSWATPSLPLAGLQGGVYVVPPMNAGVWVEFEQGNPDFPIVTGYYWDEIVEAPSNAHLTTPGAPVFLVQTLAQNVLVVSDVPIPPMKGPGIMLRAGPTSITIDPSGVTIMAPKITILGVTDINGGALLVT